jgi:hypothetical protein
MGKLANEKTLELNITHELLSSAGIGAYGSTQDQESISGADVYFPCSVPIVLQYKAAKKGLDSYWGKFSVNSNQEKNQHMVLHRLSQSGIVRAFYVFPLISSDFFLMANFGHLLDFTCAVDAHMITRNLRWYKKEHKVIMAKSHRFKVKSEDEFEATGFSARKIVDILEKSKYDVKFDLPISKFVPDLIKRLNKSVQEAKIYGNSEHTIYVIATNQTRNKFRYLALSARITGLSERTDEKIIFT